MSESLPRIKGVDEVALASLQANPKFRADQSANLGLDKLVYMRDGIVSGWYKGTCVYCQRVKSNDPFQETVDKFYGEALVSLSNAYAAESNLTEGE